MITKATGFGSDSRSNGRNAMYSKSNRKYKDTLFRYLFKEKSAMLELYNALFDDNITDENLIEDCTLEDVLYQNRKNDLAFRVNGKRVIILAEHQSTINENMPIRFLIYLGRTYERLLENENVYRKRKIDLDAPQFVVFYNGEEDNREYWEMNLMDSFPSGCQNSINLRVKVFNVNLGKNQKLLQKAKTLYGYSYFIDEVRENNESGCSRSDAIQYAAQKCIAEGILQEQLEDLGSEVMNMLTEEFDMETALRVSKEEGEEKGKIITIFGLVKDGLINTEVAAQRLNLSEEKFNKLYKKWCTTGSIEG